MKKCPTCEKTFDDNMKFCQADGTALVEDKPADPYATMVGNQADFQVPPKEDAPSDSKSVSEEDSQDDDGDVLEVPEASEADPMKTMIAGKDTSSNVRVDIPGETDKDPAPPEPPKFDAPEVAPPDLTKDSTEAQTDSSAPEDVDTPPPSPFDADDGDSKDSSVPIPSPFDESMPPGYAPPSTPPFDPSEPVVAEKIASASDPVDSPKPTEDYEPNVASTDDWTPPSAPVAEWNDKTIEENTPLESPPGVAEGKDQMLAIISVVCGGLSMTICCFAGILLGPLGAILGFIAKGKADSNPTEFGGRGLALAGMITGGIGTLFGIILIVLQIFSGLLQSF